MNKKHETFLRLTRMSIMLLIAVSGIVCLFFAPKQGFYMFLSSTFIAISYFSLLHHPKRQWFEIFLLSSVLSATAYAYISKESWANWFFLSQLLYFLYSMGRAFIFKELKDTLKYFKHLNTKGKT